MELLYVYIVLIVFSLNPVESEHLQALPETDNDPATDSCKGRYEEEFFITTPASTDCYRAWKYGASYIDELWQYYGGLCDPNCIEVLGRLEKKCGIPGDAEYSMEQLRHVCAKNEAGKHCYTLALDKGGEVSHVYTQCWEEANINSCTVDCKMAIEQ